MANLVTWSRSYAKQNRLFDIPRFMPQRRDARLASHPAFGFPDVPTRR